MEQRGALQRATRISRLGLVHRPLEMGSASEEDAKEAREEGGGVTQQKPFMSSKNETAGIKFRKENTGGKAADSGDV